MLDHNKKYSFKYFLNKKIYKIKNISVNIYSLKCNIILFKIKTKK